MSANNEVLIRRKQNGLYEIRELQTEDGSIEDNTIKIVAEDVDGLQNAVDRANIYLEQCEEEGFPVEYGLRII